MRYGFVVCVLAAASACVPPFYDDRCGPEYRDQWTEVPLIDVTGADLGKAVFTVAERRSGSEPPRMIGLTLLGPRSGALGGPLKGHVTAVLLSDAVGPLQLDFPVTPPPLNGIEIIGTTTIAIDEIATFSGLRQTVIDGQLRLHIETDPGGPAVNDVRFPAAPLGGWTRNHCS
jgi:hypothetical protein